MKYDLDAIKPWEAQITDADDWERLTFVRRVFRAEMAAAKRELGGKA